MKIAVVGAYGGGKTTLVARLAEMTGLPVVHGKPMRDPGGDTKSLEEAEPVELIQLVVRRLTERVAGEARHERGFVSDGSLLHEWIYATVRLAVGMHPAEETVLERADRNPYADVVAALGREIIGHAEYDHVFHLPVEYPLQDRVKPISERFRELSDRLMLRTFAAADMPVHPVTGTVEARLATILGKLRA